jgi:NAD(P)-dependent dehydrogenase (short-subunit alcohol dehydrogenase family)
MSRLQDKVALVTGSTSGIGRAIARAYAAEGAAVVVHGRDADRGKAVVAEITADGGRADLVLADLTRPDEARRLVDDAVALHSRLDVVVNNAGSFVMGPFTQVTEETLDTALAANLVAPLLVTQRALPALAASRGSVLNVTTGGAHRGAAGMSVYGAAKAALHVLTLNLAAELGGQGIRVNELVPGATETPMTAPMMEMPGMRDMLVARIPLGRAGRPEDLAGAAVFLASDDAAYVTGAVLAVDGGFLAAS